MSTQWRLVQISVLANILLLIVILNKSFVYETDTEISANKLNLVSDVNPVVHKNDFKIIKPKTTEKPSTLANEVDNLSMGKQK